jgi:hypothetical protein
MEKTKTGNSVIGEAIITSMQFTIEYNTEAIKLSKPEHTLVLAYKNLQNEHKKQVLNEIKDNWIKIWDEPTSKLHESYILNTPFKKGTNVFLFLHQCMKVCIESGVNFEPSFFDEKWNNIKEVCVKYQGDDEVAKKFLILENAAELQSTLVTKEEPKIPVKPKKI